MQESLRERAYYVLSGLRQETVAKCIKGSKIIKAKLPLEEPSYNKMCELLGLLKKEVEASDPTLVGMIDSFLKYGSAWSEVYSAIYWDTSSSSNIRKYDALLSKLIGSLKVVTKSKLSGSISLSDNLLEEGMKFFKVNVQGYSNEVDADLPTIDVVPSSRSDLVVKKGKGDPAVYIHNPLREDIVFVKDRFLGERFSKYLVDFMKAKGLNLYLCRIETMFGYIVKKYGKGTAINIVAVSKNVYARQLDDRTLFIILEKTAEGYVPIEIFYGGLQSIVSLVQMQTFAFCAGLTPDEISTFDIAGEFESFGSNEISIKVIDPDAIALLGWWNGSFKRIITLYFHQSMRMIYSDFVFDAINFLKSKGLKVGTNLFRDAAKNGFSLSDAEGLRMGFRYDFKNFLETSYQKEHTEESSDYVLENLFHILSMTRFSDDPKEDDAQRRKEVFDLLNNHSEISAYKDELKEKLKKIAEDTAKTVVEKENSMLIDNVKQSLLVKVMSGMNPSERFMFVKPDFLAIKSELLKIDKKVLSKDIDNEIAKMLGPVFDGPLRIQMGGKSMYSFPPGERAPVEQQALDLIKKGFKTIIFYGTSGGVKDSPVEAFVIPKTIYFYPENYFRISPEKYVPLPISNILLEKTANDYFNTDNFSRTEHIFVSGTYQEHEGFLTSVFGKFSKDAVSVDMDLAPLAKVCMEHHVGFGGILYNTDVLKGAHQETEKKGYYMRQMLLSFLRAYDSSVLKFNGKDVEELFGHDFEALMRRQLEQAVKGEEKKSSKKAA